MVYYTNSGTCVNFRGSDNFCIVLNQHLTAIYCIFSIFQGTYFFLQMGYLSLILIVKVVKTIRMSRHPNTLHPRIHTLEYIMERYVSRVVCISLE